MGYKQKAISGFSWQTILKITTNGLVFVKIFFLARILNPDDFGLFSITAIVLGISEALTQTGINTTIIQAKQKVSYFLNTAWVIAILRGFAIAILMLLMGLIVSKSFHNPNLIYLIALSSLIPIIKGFINPAIVSLQKEMEFNKDSFYQISLVVIESILAVVLALFIKNSFALVLALIGSAIFEVFLSFILLKLRPSFQYLPSRAKEIFNNMKWLNFTSLFHYLNDNVDDFLIGKLTNTYQLGLYHNAYSLSHKLNYELSKSALYSTLPILTKIKDDPLRTKKAFLKSLVLIIIISLIASLPLLIAPKFIISLVLSEKWLEILPILPWLVLAGLVHTISNYSYTLFLAKKEYGFMNTHLAVCVIFTIVFITVFTPNYGLKGAVISLTIARLITLPIVLIGLKKTLK